MAGYSIYELGFGKNLIRNVSEDLDIPFVQEQEPTIVSSESGYSGGLFNPVESVVQTQAIQSGELPAILKYAKANFQDTTEGWIQGVDSDKVYKWLIGGASQSIDWAVTTASTLTIKGNVTATTGSIGGWTITATTLHSGSVITLDSGNRKIWINSGTFGADGIQLDYNSGNPRFYVGNGVGQYFQFNGTNISWSSLNTNLSTAGKLTTTSATIGGWSVITGYIYNLQGGTPTAAPNDGIVMASGNEGIIVYEDTAKRAELGYLSAGIYGLKGYATDGTTTIFELSDTQQKIAGFYFTDTVLRSNTTDAASSIFLDSANSLIRAGVTTGNYLTLDGANLRLRSSNYVSGFAGAGFTLEPDLLEVGNIACRGLLRTYVLQKDILSVNAGSLIVAPNADVLDANMTALDASTLTIKGTVTFTVNDILRIKDGTDDEWLLVTNIASAPTYTVTRDQASAYAANSNPAWKKGASVVNYGQSGAGGLYLTASDTNNPYLSVYTHAGAPWTTITTQLRVGNLNGYLGYVADTWGFGAGSSTGTNANITIETTNGIRLRKGTTNSITLDNSGNITVGEVGAGLANTYISAGALSLRLNTTAYFSIDTSGNVLVGQTGAGQSNVYVTSGAIQLRNNTTVSISLDTSGNITVGQVAASQSNVYISSGKLALRNNTTEKIVLTSAGVGYFSGALTIGDGATTSGSITLNHFNTGGDTYISGGTITIADWTTQNGFIIGLDDSDSDKFKAYFGDSTTGYQWDWNVTTANVLTVNGSSLASQDTFGDGSDGDVTISGDTTLTSDMFYDDLTVNNTFTLNTGGYRIFVKGILTNNGTIARNGSVGTAGGNGTTGGGGNTGTAGIGGAAMADGSLKGALAGKDGVAGLNFDNQFGIGVGANGTAGTAGLNGVNINKSLVTANAVAGTNGAAGGSVTNIVPTTYTGGAGGAGGGGGSRTGTIFNKVKNFLSTYLMLDIYPESGGNAFVEVFKAAPSSGSGGVGGHGGWWNSQGAPYGNSSGSGGGSGGCGSNGGIVWVAAKKIVNTGTISANGGAGGAGGLHGDSTADLAPQAGCNLRGGGGGSSGGSGGSGGAIIYIYSSLTNSGTIQAAGGAGGVGGAGGIAAWSGANCVSGGYVKNDGVAGSTGTTGQTGIIIALQV